MTTRDNGTQLRLWKVLRAAIAPIAITAVLIASMLAASKSDAPTASKDALAAMASFAQANVPLPAACKPTPNPPPTEYGFVARVENGTIGGENFEVSEIDVSVCGILRVINATAGSGCDGIQARLVIPSDGVIVRNMKAELTTIPGIKVEVPIEVKAEATTSDVACASSSGGLKTDLTLKVTGKVGAFGLKCGLPISGEAKSTITGALLTPPYQGSTTLTGDLSIGKVTNNDKFCPGNLPDHVNAIAETPASGNGISWPAKISVYHP